MLERNFQVLSVIAEHQDGQPDGSGIKTSDVFAACKQLRNCMLKDQQTTSSVIFNLKNSGLLNAHKHEKSPDTYTITKTGLQSLIANGWKPEHAELMRTQEKPSLGMKKPSPDLPPDVVRELTEAAEEQRMLKATDTLIDTNSEIEDIRRALSRASEIIDGLQRAKVPNKETKMQVLKRLSDMFKDDIAQELDDIASFLNQFDAA